MHDFPDVNCLLDFNASIVPGPSYYVVEGGPRSSNTLSTKIFTRVELLLVWHAELPKQETLNDRLLSANEHDQIFKV